MNKPKLSNISRGIRLAFARHSPEILTGVGIAGMITATVMAIRATPKALMLIDEQRGKSNVVDLSAVEIIKTAWMCYIPTVITGSLSIACLVGANSVNARRNAAIATAYTLSESAMKEYQEKIIETIGEKKEQAVRESIAKDKIDRDPVAGREVIFTENGNTLCYDAISGRYFKSDIEKIKKAVNEVNRNIVNDMYVSLNDFYDELGLENTSIGRDLGWNVANGLIDPCFSSHLASNGTPCLVIDYRVAPCYDYYR